MTREGKKVLECIKILNRSGLIYESSNLFINYAYVWYIEKYRSDDVLDNPLYDYSLDNIRKYTNSDQNLIKASFEVNEILASSTINGVREVLIEILEAFDTRGQTKTPKVLVDFVFKMLDFKENEINTFCDFGSGIGNVLYDINRNAEKNNINIQNITGVEINLNDTMRSKMIIEMLYENFNKYYIFNNSVYNELELSYNKAFTFTPIYNLKKIEKESKLFPGYYLNLRSTQFVFIDKMLAHLEENGRAVAIVLGSTLFNRIDLEYRNMLIEEGWVEAIIELPNGSILGTYCESFIMVFSHNNKYIKFINTKEYLEDNFKTFNLEELLNKAYIEYNSESVYKKSIENLNMIINLMPSKVKIDVVELENGVELESIAEVFAGAQYTKSKFQNKISLNKTSYRLVTAGDIEDGKVDWNSLDYVDLEDNKFDKYALKKGDIIMTSKSTKVKLAVCDFEPTEKILVIGGMNIIRPISNEINSTYLKVFFDSKNGEKLLKSIQKGVSIFTINPMDLRKIKIPMTDLPKQIEIEKKYKMKINKMQELKEEIKRIEKELQEIL